MEDRGVLRGSVRTSGAIPAVTVSTQLAPLFDECVGGWRGSVLSVHGSAVNLVVDGELVTVAAAAAGGLPNGLLIADPFDPRSLGVRAGMRVLIAGELEIEGSLLRIEPRGARQWRPELRSTPPPHDLHLRAGIARRAAVSGGSGFRGIVSAGSAFAAFAAAFASGSQPAILETGRKLVGLGYGLTPSGDDVLVGLTAGLTAIGDERARGFAGFWAAHAFGRTTMVAETFHRHAAGGAYAERLHDVLREILTGPVDAIPSAIQAATAWGATSGTDTLAGVLLALHPPLAGEQLGAA
jgi:uncharacterized protein DUF2877